MSNLTVSDIGFRSFLFIFNNPKSLLLLIEKDSKSEIFSFSIKEIKLFENVLVYKTKPFTKSKEDLLIFVSNLFEEAFKIGSSQHQKSVKLEDEKKISITSSSMSSLRLAMATERDIKGNIKETLTQEMIGKIMFALRRNDLVTTSELNL